jgi:DNA-binding XRE family transcriptional regulator
MARDWTPAERARQSAIATAWWRKKAESDPLAHPLKLLRAERDYTQADVGLMASLPPSTIAFAESGGKVSRFVRERICEALKAPESELWPS